MSFHPRTGISEGVSADRPRLSSSCSRSPPAKDGASDRRGPNPSATSKALSPIVHNGGRPGRAPPAASPRCRSPTLMRWLHSAGALPICLQLRRGITDRNILGCEPSPVSLVSGSFAARCRLRSSARSSAARVGGGRGGRPHFVGDGASHVARAVGDLACHIAHPVDYPLGCLL